MNKLQPFSIIIASLFTLIVVLMLAFWYTITTQINELQTIVTETRVESGKLFLSGRMAETARARIRITSEILKTEDLFDQDELTLKLGAKASSFIKDRELFLRLPLSIEEKEIFKRQSIIVPRIKKQQADIVEMAMSEDPKLRVIASNLLFEQLYEKQGELIDTLLKLSKLSQKKNS